jgi:hypothetical protein
MVIAEPPTSFEELRRYCAGVWDQRLKFVNERVALFCLARWCQKQVKALEPDLGKFSDEELACVARNIASNLRRDGERVELLLARDGDEWTKLWRELFESVSHLAPRDVAEDLTGDALLKVIQTLATGTKPSCARCRLDGDVPRRPECADCSHERGVRGPGNEYVFASPFAAWARTIARNIVFDWYGRELVQDDPASSSGPDEEPDATGLRNQLMAVLLSLLEAIRGLPNKQRAAIVASFCRTDIDPEAYERLRSLAPDLFEQFGAGLFESDKDIAARLGTKIHLVRANRSVARRGLCEQDPRWELLLEFFMPHHSTKQARDKEARDG